MIKKLRLLGSKTLTSGEKSILFDLIKLNSKEVKDRLEAENKFTTYYMSLYIKYLIPKDLYKLSKKCPSDFMYRLSGITIEPRFFNIDSEDFKNIYIKFSEPLIDVRYIYTKNIDDVYNFSIGMFLHTKLNDNEKYLLKDLYCDFMEKRNKERSFIELYKNQYDYFPNIDTWDSLYNLNQDWYDLLYNHLSNVLCIFDKTKFDKEINETEDLNTLMKKVINYINE